MPATKPIPFEGVLNCWYDEHDLADLLLTICRSQKTGRLRFSNPEGDKTLYVKDGRVIFAESSSDDDGLGQHLLRIGKISLADYARVSKLVEPGKRLGALLVSEGVLEPKELVPAVVGQVRAIILGLFRRTESWYGFREEELPRKESITLDMPVAELILRGVQYVESWRRVSKGLGDFERVHRVADAAKNEWSQLEPAAAELLSILDEPVTITQACARSRLTDFEACRFLWAFRSLAWIVETPEAEAVAEATTSAAVVEPAEEVVNDVPDQTPALAETEEGVGDEDFDQAALAIAADAVSEIPADVEDAAPVKPSIPARLVQTQISVKPPPKQTPKPAPPAKGPQPPAIPDELVKTQLVIETPASRASAPRATTVPDVRSKPTPKPVPDDLVHTRLDVATPPKEKTNAPGATLSTPSAAEMMESILSEGGTAPASPKAPAPPKAEPPPGSNVTTQFFSGPSAFDFPEPPEADEDSHDEDAGAFSLPDESYDDFLSGNMGPEFDSLAVEHAAPAPTPEEPAAPLEATAPAPLPEDDQLTMASFQDFSLSDPAVEPPAAPEPEPSFVEAPVVAPAEAEALPVLEGVIVDAEPEPEASEPSGMEAFITDDPFAAPAEPATSTELSPFSSEDLLTRREEPVAAALPKRPRADDMDLDADGLGHVLGRDR